MTDQMPISFAGRATAITLDHFGTVATDSFSWPTLRPGQDSYNEHYYSGLENGSQGGEFQDGTRLDTVLEQIGTTMIRYPGGTEAWKSFNWREGEQSVDQYGLTDHDKLQRVIEYCASTGMALSFTFPVRGIDLTDPNEKAAIEDFVLNHLLIPAETLGVELAHIKMGNEYHIAPQMSAEDYGDVASQLTEITGTLLDEFALTAGPEWIDPQIIIESGVLWQFGAGDVRVDRDGDGIKESNGIADNVDVIAAFNASEAAHVDGIDIHVLTLDVDYNKLHGSDAATSPDSWKGLDGLYDIMITELDALTEAAAGWQDVSYHSLAWSLPKADGKALSGAGLAIHQMYQFSANGIETGISWMAAGFGSNNLSNPAILGQAPETTDLAAGGIVVSLMQDVLPGLTAYEATLTPGDVSLLSFAGDGSYVIYAINESGGIQNIDNPLSQLLLDLGGLDTGYQIEVTRLSTADLDAQDVDITVNAVAGSSADLSFDGLIQLEAHEIIQITYTSDDTSGAASSAFAQLPTAEYSELDSDDVDHFEFIESGDTPEPDLEIVAAVSGYAIDNKAIEAELFLGDQIDYSEYLVLSGSEEIFDL